MCIWYDFWQVPWMHGVTPRDKGQFEEVLGSKADGSSEDNEGGAKAYRKNRYTQPIYL